MAWVALGMAATMALCAVIAWFLPDRRLLIGTEEQQLAAQALNAGSYVALMTSALVTGALGAALWWFARSEPQRALDRREATLVVAIIWMGAGVIGGFPFVFDAHMSPVDAYFEAISGFTTTGATIVTDIEGGLSHPLLLWRSAIQWLGGMGIVVLFIAVFPALGVGGKYLFRGEAPGPPSEGLQPRIADTSLILWRFYLFFTALQVVALRLLGLDLFEAICHAFTTMSTGGFSTRDASVAAFDNPAVEVVIAVFMLIAGVNFSLYYVALSKRSLRGFARSSEFRAYVAIVVGATLLLTIGVLGVHDNNPLQALRYSLFQVATFVTSTGYGTDDYMLYPAPPLTIVLLLMVCGGMAGSTAGGMKVARIVILGKFALNHIRSSFRPSVVQVIRMGRRAVPESVLVEVTAMFVVFAGFIGFGTLAITYLDGVTTEASFGAVLSCVSNMGPAPFHQGPDNFAAYSDFSKLLFSVAMVLGRLEFFTLLALLVPSFWKR